MGIKSAAQKLWQRYLERLIRVASRHLKDFPRRMADEEDAVVVAFASFLQGVDEGRFAELEDRDDLWQVLVMLTERKATDQIRRELTGKRGQGHVRGDSVLDAGNSTTSQPHGFEQFANTDPSPEFAAEMTELLERLFTFLDDPMLREIAQQKMAGHTNSEVAERLGISLRSVERALALIRRIWNEDCGALGSDLDASIGNESCRDERRPVPVRGTASSARARARDSAAKHRI